MDDNMIVDMLWKRTEDALENVCAKYGTLCHSVSYSILRSHEDAEECVNDTYMKIWTSIPPNRPNNLKAYIAKIARNLSIDKLRGSSANKRGSVNRDVALSELEDCLPDVFSVEDALEQKELAEAINRFLLNLPAEQRLRFVGRYWNYLSVTDLAEEFEFSKSKIKSILFRVRGELRTALESEGYRI